jgi:hypothetical protein
LKAADKKGKVVSLFFYLEDDSNGLVLHASIRYVKVVEEGEREQILHEAYGEGEEEKVKWKDSEAKANSFQECQRKSDSSTMMGRRPHTTCLQY